MRIHKSSFIMLISLAALLMAIVGASQAVETSTDEGLNRTWLICGEFPNPQRIYQIAIWPELSWELMKRHRNLRHVQAGPDFHPQDIWQEMLIGGF